MATVLVPLAPGCEELEATTVTPLLRRAQVEVVVAGLEPAPVRCSRAVPTRGGHGALDGDVN